MNITNTLKENSVLIAVAGFAYFAFFRDRDTGPTAEATGPGGTAIWRGGGL